MNSFERDMRRQARYADMRERAERLQAKMDRDCAWDRRKIKRIQRLLYWSKRLNEVRGLRFAAKGFRTRP